MTGTGALAARVSVIIWGERAPRYGLRADSIPVEDFQAVGLLERNCSMLNCNLLVRVRLLEKRRGLVALAPRLLAADPSWALDRAFVGNVSRRMLGRSRGPANGKTRPE